MLHLYPDSELQRDSNWLKRIQDRVGAWHDEMAFGQRAIRTFDRLPRDANLLKFIRRIKEKELRLGEAAQLFICSLRGSADYRRLRRRLSASVFALSEAGRPTNGAEMVLAG